MQLFFLEKKKGLEIQKFLKNNIEKELNKNTIYKILTWLRTAIAHYLKDIYRLYKLGKSERGSLINIDESLFIHINDEKIWIVGAKNNQTCNIRLDVFKTRNEEDMKIFINNYIKEYNTIITDGWCTYQFLDHSNYVHEVHIHGPNGNFGFVFHSTSKYRGSLGNTEIHN